MAHERDSSAVKCYFSFRGYMPYLESIHTLDDDYEDAAACRRRRRGEHEEEVEDNNVATGNEDAIAPPRRFLLDFLSWR